MLINNCEPYHQILEDEKIWEKDKLLIYLYGCFLNDIDSVIDFKIEGSCLHANRMYNLLDNFCLATNYKPSRIKILTANLVEKHDRYTIIKNLNDWWATVANNQRWLEKNPIQVTKNPTKHFGNFIGRSTWNRLWIASLLYYKFKDKTIQTFHSKINGNYTVKQDGIYDYLGLEDLVKYDCNILSEVVNFLRICPLAINDDLLTLEKTLNQYYIPQTTIYPIQVPGNLNIISLYNDIFVDIVCETRTIGNTFFLSEKLWRCVMAKRPFIVVGPMNFLSNLKKLGFLTFNNFWDEGYDEYTPGDRIKQIEKVLDYVSNWSLEELNKKLILMEDILQNNFEVFQNLTQQQIKDVFAHD